MQSTFTYALNLDWTGNRGTGTSSVRAFDRTLRVDAEGRPSLDISADAPFHGAVDQWNPEQLLLASLSSCHMLSYLFVAVRDGIVVTEYQDSPTALLRLERDGSGRIESAVLRPRVVVQNDAMRAAAHEAHDVASSLCFIKNSVNFSVSIQPTIDFASR